MAITRQVARARAFDVFAPIAPTRSFAVKLLLSWGANPNCRDKVGETPLHKAAFGNYDYVCRLLLEAGCVRNDRALLTHMIAHSHTHQDVIETSRTRTD